METLRMETLIAAAHECAAAAHGESGAIINRAARVLNLSPGRTHALVAKTARSLGLAAPRKKRADAGESAISDADMEVIAGARWKDMRNGKRMIPLEETIDMLYQAGNISARLSASHVARLLRQRGMDLDSLTTPPAHVRMRTEHVNAVLEADASVCVLYRAPSGELRLINEGGVHYKNKPHNLVPVLDKLLTRFVAVEHASGCIAVRFYVGGETTANLLDFLMWVMTQRHDAKGAPAPFHGVPYMLYSDQGGMFKSGPVRSFCSAMGIRQQWHAPGNSRATGSVEVAQNIVERGLESRLRYIDRASLSVPILNALAETWMHAYNGTKQPRPPRHDALRPLEHHRQRTPAPGPAPGNHARAAQQPERSPHRQHRHAGQLRRHALQRALRARCESARQGAGGRQPVRRARRARGRYRPRHRRNHLARRAPRARGLCGLRRQRTRAGQGRI